jgi:hypothetical protein
MKKQLSDFFCNFYPKHSNPYSVVQRGYRVKQLNVSVGVGIEGRDNKGPLKEKVVGL